MLPLPRISTRESGGTAFRTSSSSTASTSVLAAVSRPSSFTTVFAASMAAADGSTSSTRGRIADLNGMETEQPRIPRARTPRTAPSRSSVLNALYTKSRPSSS
jgi:hypothetical protein